MTALDHETEEPSPAKNVRRRGPGWLWGLLAIAGAGTAGYAIWPYLSLNPDTGPLPLDPTIESHYLSVVVHALPGALALLLGPVQFLPVVRRRWPRAHRIMGRTYMVSVAAAASAAFVAATFSVSGLPAQIAFYILAVAWLYTLGRAYRAIRSGAVQQHRVWMIRNYSLTFAAVTLRVYLLSGIMLMEPLPALAFEDIYTVSVWASILINVLISEYVIVHRVAAKTRRHRHNPQAMVG